MTKAAVRDRDETQCSLVKILPVLLFIIIHTNKTVQF